jgi:hypothetical protein
MQKSLLIFGVLVVFGFVVFVSGVHGEDTFASQPSYSSADDHFYEQLYRTEFDSIDDSIIEGPGNVYVQNGVLHIDGQADANPNGYNLMSRRIDYSTTDFLYDGFCYDVKFDFSPKDVTHSFFRVFFSFEIDLYTSTENDQIKLYVRYYYEGQYHDVYVDTLIAGNWYTFWIQAWHQANRNRYDLIIESVNKGSFQYNSIFTAHPQQVSFGDFGQLDTGGGKWDWFEFVGWSKAQYFNNFNDGSAHEFRKISYKHQRAPVSAHATVKVEDNSLFFDTYWNTNPPVLYKGYIFTEYINYNPTETWRISLDFKVSNNINQWFILTQNKQATIVVKGANLYWYDNQLHLIKNLQTDQWYFLELEKTAANKYRVLLNNDVEATGCDFEKPLAADWWDFLGIGDFGDFDWVDGIYIDNLKIIVESRSHTDTDSDGLGDDFENDGDIPKVYIWSTDFEDRTDGRVLDVEELGWDFDPLLDDPNADTIWEKGEPTYDDPFGLNPTPATGHAEGIHPASDGKVIGTDLDNVYAANTDDAIITPRISMEYVVNSARITFWHWYHTEQGEQGDGGKVMISSDGGDTWSLLGSLGDPYNTDDVDVLDDDPGFTGSSGEWKYVVFDLDSNYVGTGKVIRLKFIFASDAQSEGSGWYIDDIKIFGNLADNVGDTDGDLVEDGEEFHKYCSSPFLKDTDGDSLSDKDEVSNSELADYDYYVGHSTYNYWSDPLTKDIWIEVDEMDNVAQGRRWNNNNDNVRTTIEGWFSEHEIRVHFVYSEEIDGINGATWNQLKDIARLKSNGGEREDNHDGIYHYLIWAQTASVGSWLGISYTSHWFLVVFANHNNLNTDAKRAKTTNHEIGHNLGLWHYRPDEYEDDNNDNPPDSSMRRGTGTWTGYLGEESDWSYDFDSGNPGEQEDDRILGGWEYSHTALDTYVRGLDYSGIKKANNYFGGWSYQWG